MANRARARSTWAAGALSERLRRVSSWRSSAVSGRMGSFRWRDMGHLGARGSPPHYTSSHGRRPTSDFREIQPMREQTDMPEVIEPNTILRRLPYQGLVTFWRAPYVQDLECVDV